MADSMVLNAISNHLSTLITLLSNPSCRIIKPIKIDFNLIEVQPKGVVFVISKREFKRCKRLPSNTTPRTFVRYKYDANQVPYPKPFVEGK